mmetsp:Transcript_36194/g.63762  ORF Transcript_36194/g.63762 Transcript_36194/m.63762 type:complete len:224 (-) Transcript_36194:27-698(-)
MIPLSVVLCSAPCVMELRAVAPQIVDVPTIQITHPSDRRHAHPKGHTLLNWQMLIPAMVAAHPGDKLLHLCSNWWATAVNGGSGVHCRTEAAGTGAELCTGSVACEISQPWEQMAPMLPTDAAAGVVKVPCPMDAAGCEGGAAAYAHLAESRGDEECHDLGQNVLNGYPVPGIGGCAVVDCGRRCPIDGWSRLRPLLNVIWDGLYYRCHGHLCILAIALWGVP